MDRMPRMACLWPGLPTLWYSGSWPGLGLALGFSCLVSCLIAAAAVWTQWLNPSLLRFGWGAAGLIWVASTWISLSRRSHAGKSGGAEPDTSASEEPDLFADAQLHYLRGNWYEAQALLEQMLRQRPQDVDARLMLAALHRHNKRWDEAEELLESLAQLDGSYKWLLEIHAERQLIAGQREHQTAELQQSTSAGGTVAELAKAA